jgi:surfactin synthase thioesterase subunit
VFDDIEVSTFELPGRGRRIGAPLLDACDPMVDDLLLQVRPLLREPYALFGHSMGALLAYLVAQRVRREGLPLPSSLIVSGGPAPSRITSRGWHLLPRPEFLRVLSGLGGCPPAILAEPELMDLYEPVLRADFTAMATYCHKPAEPFGFPITSLVGTEDHVSEDEARDWQQETAQRLRLHRFPGDHFFIFRHWPQIRQIVSMHARILDQGVCTP